MVSVVPQTPGLGDLLGLGLGQGVQQGSQMITEQILKEQSKRAVANRLAQILGVSPVETGGMSQVSSMGNEITPEKIMALAADPELANVASVMAQLYAPEHKAKIEQKQQAAEETKTKQNFGKIVNKLEDLKPYAGATEIPFTKSFGGGKVGFNREAVQKRAQIKTLSSSLVPILREMLTKGQINQVEFESFMERIPKPEDSEREYQGKLDAFKDLLQLPANQKQEEKKVSSGKKLSRANAQKILQEVGGDPEKARQRARELGFEF